MATIASIEPCDVGEADRQVADQGGAVLAPALARVAATPVMPAPRSRCVRCAGVRPPVRPECSPATSFRVVDRFGRLDLLGLDEVVADSSPNQRAAVSHVLVAAAGEVDQEQTPSGPSSRPTSQRAGERVRALDGRDDALGAAEQRERLHRLGRR